MVQPRLAGHGPTLFAGLSKYIDLKLVGRKEFRSGAVVMRYEPRRQPSRMEFLAMEGKWAEALLLSNLLGDLFFAAFSEVDVPTSWLRPRAIGM